MLDFYESLANMPKVIAAVQGASQELSEAHRPDNGLLASCLELSTMKALIAEFKAVLGEADGSLAPTKGSEYLEDDAILGNSDKMLFYSKELKSSVENESKAHNPFVVGKLDLASLRNFDFEAFYGYLETRPARDTGQDEEAEAARKVKINQRNFGRFFPKLNERGAQISIPSMLTLSCNIIEALRLRSTLVRTLE